MEKIYKNGYRTRARIHPISYFTDRLDYDAKTGIFTWRYRTDVAHNINMKRWGKQALPNKRGHYIEIRINGELFKAHQIAYYIYHGVWPKAVDHINQNKSDNRIVNLRECNQSINGRNLRMNRNNTSGQMGVSYRKDKNTWCAYIGCSGINDKKRINLGNFKNKQDAIRARKKAEKELNYSKNHGNKP